jgi:hypothetical protein
MDRREFLKKAGLLTAGGAISAGVIAKATTEAVGSDATAKAAQDAADADPDPEVGPVIHPYFLDKGWEEMIHESELEICVKDPDSPFWPGQWLSVATIRADDLETKRAIWHV